MVNLSDKAVIRSVVDLLTEAYAGPPDPSSTWFIDNDPDAGIFGILAGVSAAEASKSVHTAAEMGSSVASHAEHLRWSLQMMNAAVRGIPFDEKWSQSWNLQEVDEAGWDRLRGALKNEYESLRQVLLEQDELSEQYLTGFLALLPHAAYHLGTIRQMVERVRERKTT